MRCGEASLRLPDAASTARHTFLCARSGPYVAVENAMHRFANPARFARLAAAITPWSAALTGLLFAVGLTLALIASPPDYQQGETVRIMYVHVPAAWLASVVYVVVAAGSAVCAGLAPSAGRPGGRAESARSAPASPRSACDRLALGQADVGRLVGVGRAADLGAGAVLPLSRPHRAGARLRRSDARRTARARSWRWSAW